MKILKKVKQAKVAVKAARKTKNIFTIVTGITKLKNRHPVNGKYK